MSYLLSDSRAPVRRRGRMLAAAMVAVASVALMSSTSASAGVYGPGVNADTKSNRRVDGGLGIAHRFRAATTSRVRAVMIQVRLGSGYSRGNGGRYRVSIQTDDGSRAHHPSGKVLTKRTWRPGNDGNSGIRRLRFHRQPRLVRGRIYHVVVTNTSGAPGSNYVSLNELFTFEALSPRQPTFADGIYAVINGTRRYGSGRSWWVDPRHTPVMDVVYRNGKHQGMSYLNAMRNQWAPIGGSHQVRERFTVRNRDRRVVAACARVGRQSGSSPITFALRRRGHGLIEHVREPSAGQVALTEPGSDADNGDWVCAEFEATHVLRKGETYDLVLSAPADSQYSMTPILARDFSSKVSMRSYHFRSGRGERSRDGGSSWTAMYRWQPQNTQMYLVTR